MYVYIYIHICVDVYDIRQYHLIIYKHVYIYIYIYITSHEISTREISIRALRHACLQSQLAKSRFAPCMCDEGGGTGKGTFVVSFFHNTTKRFV